jgi:hypothetical protein
MASILDGLGLEGSVLDGLAEWPASTTRKEWFAITRQLIQETIADMDLDAAALAEVEEAFIGACFSDKTEQRRISSVIRMGLPSC